MNKVRDALLGLAVGDALGVPVEFTKREDLQDDPVTTMRAYGCYKQPRGTWSDDTSLTFCLAESLIKGYDLEDISRKFISWRNNAYMTPHGEVFDIGIRTNDAISVLEQIINSKDYAQLKTVNENADEYTNGNGSLMRILPALFYVKDLETIEKYKAIKEISSLTHGHIRCIAACVIYLLFAEEILNGKSKDEAYTNMQEKAGEYFASEDVEEDEQYQFDRIIEDDIREYEEDEIFSSGYVLHSIEAALWCFMKNDTYSEIVLAAVNLGEDTDTTAAIAGGLAGLFYGSENIPKTWLDNLAQRERLENICDRLNSKQLGSEQ